MTLRLKETRKVFFGWYLIAVLGLGGLVYYAISIGKINNYAMLFSTATISALIIVPEIIRVWEVIDIEKEHISITSGLIRKSHKKYFINTITDIHYSQNFWQRLLGYGHISVSLFSKEGNVSLGNVDNPKQKVHEMENILKK